MYKVETLFVGKKNYSLKQIKKKGLMAAALAVLESCRISPPPATVGERSLQLTFFDLTWLQFFPINQLFFFDFPSSRTHFIETIVPNLKHSLSITLQHFFPFAGNLITFPNQNKSKKPEIRYVEGDSVSVTFAESSHDYHDLSGNHPRPCNKFYELVPPLGHATKVSDFVSIPLFSVQVTLFPKSGISIGLTNHHTLCDASSRFDFLKAWTSIAKHSKDDVFLANGSLPFYDRAIKYPNSLDEIYANQPGIETLNAEYQPAHPSANTEKVRATVVLTKSNINQLKTFVSANLPKLEYVSSFSVACAYTWSCIAKSAAEIGEKKSEDDLERFICPVDWRTRLNPPVPQTYFGNCVGLCDSDKIQSTIIAGNTGFLKAVEVFGKAISRTLKNKDGMLKDAETWLVRGFEPVPTIGVAGTPKVKIYDTDFGWGKPSKYETISIDYNGSLSVNGCRDSPEDIEIGLSLDAKQMDAFLIIYERELKNKMT
uniref:malonyl-coenzyme A:anthocyanin 3-O-glucoside-6''-O-malonyltransferase-like n=1 Tax=Erigeron canadensis TaxID=72917 RepID=UPI001CB963BF|nr:malonyl-coenzyme A:anthocyanin 3-O-glucoside-6''-O-malonyltransferase-like [Erigeron canadensis]